jgi:hypothetical protein
MAKAKIVGSKIKAKVGGKKIKMSPKQFKKTTGKAKQAGIPLEDFNEV